MLGGFKKFILRGNVVDMAVGVVVGGAFTAVVAALTKDLLTPLIAAIVGKPNFSAIQFTINGSVFALGDFINAVVSFLLIAASVYFLVIVPINAATAEGSKLIHGLIPKELTGDVETVISRLDDSEKMILRGLLRKLSHTSEGSKAVADTRKSIPDK